MTITADAEASAILDLAADLMEEHGWRTGDYFSLDANTTVLSGYHDAVTDNLEYVGGAMCTEGAIRAASAMIYGKTTSHLVPGTTFMGLTDQCVRALRVVRFMVAGQIQCGIPSWNDDECCSKEEAVALLRDAAIKTRPDSA